ncbi:hypothetical protein Ccrd_018648, partial [Cynara cardunculus var. scolymus]
ITIEAVGAEILEACEEKNGGDRRLAGRRRPETWKKGTGDLLEEHDVRWRPETATSLVPKNFSATCNNFGLRKWYDGLHVSPTIAGSRPGSLIARAWATMLSLGREGYLEHTREIMEHQRGYKKDTRMRYALDCCNVVQSKRDPKVVYHWKARYDDCLLAQTIHICVTLQHLLIVDKFLKDVKDFVETVKENPGLVSGGFASIYGAAGKIPDRGMVNKLLVDFVINGSWLSPEVNNI